MTHGGEAFNVDDDKTAINFKNAFKGFFGSPVVNVRRLAAKAFANFTPRYKECRRDFFDQKSLWDFVMELIFFKSSRIRVGYANEPAYKLELQKVLYLCL